MKNIPAITIFILDFVESLCSSQKSGIIGDMKKEYQATNYESDLTDKQWEAIKEFFPSGIKANIINDH